MSMEELKGTPGRLVGESGAWLVVDFGIHGNPLTFTSLVYLEPTAAVMIHFHIQLGVLLVRCRSTEQD